MRSWSTHRNIMSRKHSAAQDRTGPGRHGDDGRSLRTTRRTVAVLGALTGLLAGLLTAAAPAQAAVALPGGRPAFVVSTLTGPVNRINVRVAKYQFARSGVVTQEYWSWRQNMITGKDQGYWTKPSSGYSTYGCRFSCHIRTPVGFQSGRSGTPQSGRFSVSGTVLTIVWSTGVAERWRVNTSQPTVAGLTLISTDRTARGWGLGSNSGLGRAVGMRDIYNAKRFYGPYASNAYGRATIYSNVGFNYTDNVLCGNGICMQGKHVTAADKRTWYSNYWAANPAKDGRKVFRNHQTGVVQQIEAPGSTCISRGGGHTEALLQALDDQGRIVGLVGVEASLSQQRTGQAVVTAFAMVQPAVRSALG